MADEFRRELVGLLPRLRRFALGLTALPDRADDLVQAACERALARRGQWQPGTRLDSWMYRIMQNLWIDQLRGSRDHTEITAEEETLAAPDWTAGVQAQLALEQVLAAMQQLPPPMRAVLALVCVEEQSYQQAAEILGVPIGTVMSRLSRARRELMRLLDADKELADA